MKHVFIISLFLLVTVPTSSFSQKFKKINYEQLQQRISDEQSDYFYPNLLTRYKNGDSTLTVIDYRHLYYGFTFQDAYRPYDRYPLDKKISELMGNMSKENLQKLRELSHEYLQERPFSLKMINYLQNFNINLLVRGENKLLQRQYDGIIRAILSTGDGKSIQTAYAVNHPTDEYMVLRALNLKPIDSKFETVYDYFQVQNAAKKTTEVYFDIHRMAAVGTKQMGIEKKQVEDEKVPVDGILIGSEEEIQKFVEPGYRIFFQQQVDIDADGDKDWVLITAKEDEKQLSDFANNKPAYRIFQILVRTEDKRLTPSVITKSFIPCLDCGGSGEDPFRSIAIAPKTITLHTKGGDLFQWERKTAFEYVGEQWQLAEEVYTSYRKGKEENQLTDTETKDDFGTVLLKEFDFYKLLK